LGAVSYCVYLIHLPVNGILHFILLHSRPSIATLSGAAVTVLAAGITLALALLSWEFFEGPAVRRGHRYQYVFDAQLSLRAAVAPATSLSMD
jgi:peptidoglycan/LPS O-acetylase OafA/YrhL